MNSKLALILVLFAVGTFGLLGSSAHAQDGPWGGCYGGWGYGYLYSNLDFKIPYHAAYPPVYYSYPVPRTYGYSPFAYPPGTMTPDIVEKPVDPVTIINPYVQQEQTAEEPAAKEEKSVAMNPKTPQPLVILNPYVTASESFVQVAD
jgi:hypothetical protein